MTPGFWLVIGMLILAAWCLASIVPPLREAVERRRRVEVAEDASVFDACPNCALADARIEDLTNELRHHQRAGMARHPAGRGLRAVTCVHCGHVGPIGDDHTCSCPYSDASCPDHSSEVETHDGCDCTELCSMGPTCPGGGLAGLPGTGCWRTDEAATANVIALREALEGRDRGGTS